MLLFNDNAVKCFYNCTYTERQVSVLGQIREDIKNRQFKNIYFLFGDEAYLRIYNKNALRDALIDPGDTLNYSYFQGKSVNMSEVVDLINTMPFLSEHRVVLCENTGWLEKASGSEEDDEAETGGSEKMLTDALSSISEDVVFILCEEKVDKRSKLYKFMQKKACCEEFIRETEEKLAKWAAGYLNNAGKKIRADAVSYLVSEVGNDMTLLSLELEKLIAYCLDRDEVTMDDIDTMCTHRITDRIFDMITAISEHRQRDALSLYYDLVNLRESPFHILALLVRQYNNLLIVRDGLDNNRSYARIAEETQIKDWLVKKLAAVVRRMTYAYIAGAIEKCAATEEDVKTGNLTDSMAIELLIVTLSGTAAAI